MSNNELRPVNQLFEGFDDVFVGNVRYPGNFAAPPELVVPPPVAGRRRMTIGTIWMPDRPVVNTLSVVEPPDLMEPHVAIAGCQEVIKTEVVLEDVSDGEPQIDQNVASIPPSTSVPMLHRSESEARHSLSSATSSERSSIVSKRSRLHSGGRRRNPSVQADLPYIRHLGRDGLRNIPRKQYNIEEKIDHSNEKIPCKTVNDPHHEWIKMNDKDWKVFENYCQSQNLSANDMVIEKQTDGKDIWYKMKKEVVHKFNVFLNL